MLFSATLLKLGWTIASRLLEGVANELGWREDVALRLDVGITLVGIGWAIKTDELT